MADVKWMEELVEFAGDFIEKYNAPGFDEELASSLHQELKVDMRKVRMADSYKNRLIYLNRVAGKWVAYSRVYEDELSHFITVVSERLFVHVKNHIEKLNEERLWRKRIEEQYNLDNWWVVELEGRGVTQEVWLAYGATGYEAVSNVMDKLTLEGDEIDVNIKYNLDDIVGKDEQGKKWSMRLGK